MPKGTASSMDTDLFAAFASKVVERLPRDLDANVAQGWVDNPGSLGRILREALVPPEEKQNRQSYLVSVNYGLSLEDMIAIGRYDWKNEDINVKRFPVSPPTGEVSVVDVEIQLVHFNRVMWSGEATRRMDKMGLRPAKIEELLAFGAKFPEVQREFPVVSLWRDTGRYAYVSYLDGDRTRRVLHLNLFSDKWEELCRFAAVPTQLSNLGN